jgi:hypothetical protein
MAVSCPAQLPGAGGAALGEAADQGARDGVGGAPARGRAVEGVGAPKRRFEAISVIAEEGLPVEVACRVLHVSCSGFYAWRPCASGIEGTGSYGAALASFLRRRGCRIVEVDRGDRRGRRSNRQVRHA